MERLVDKNFQNHAVVKGVLCLALEMTQNRSQRLNFDVMVPNGVLLFRLVSKTLMAFGMFYTYNYLFLCFNIQVGHNFLI